MVVMEVGGLGMCSAVCVFWVVVRGVGASRGGREELNNILWKQDSSGGKGGEVSFTYSGWI